MFIQKVKLDKEGRLIALLDRFEPRIRDAFISAVRASKETLPITLIEQLLEAGRFVEALQVVESIPLAVSTSVDISFTQTGASTANVIAAITESQIFFDQTEPLAVQAMRANRAKLVREFTFEQRQATQEAIIDGIRRGLNPRAQALNFRDSIGLTRRQQQAVNNFRNMLENRDSNVLTRQLRDRRFDSTISRAIETDKPLTKQQISTMVQRYQERYIKYRGEVIGRTEALRSVHEANDIMFRQAIGNGDLNSDDIERQWVVTRDSRLRDSHSLMAGQRRPVGEPFLTGNGNTLMHPGDPNAPASDVIQCRCSVITRFK